MNTISCKPILKPVLEPIPESILETDRSTQTSPFPDTPPLSSEDESMADGVLSAILKLVKAVFNHLLRLYQVPKRTAAAVRLTIQARDSIGVLEILKRFL